MKNRITAEPRTIRDIFSKEYIIPEYQRRYSWEKGECEKLWEDIVDYHRSKKESGQKYFLGTIVTYSEEDKDEEKFFVIDGQQRLISLLLLIKAMHKCSGESKALEECLRKKHPLNSELLDELRVESRVIDEDENHLENIIFDKNEESSLFGENFKYFSEEIDKWRTNHNSEEFSQLVLTLLDRINLLPIKCGDQDEAMTIFQTINDRGMKLDDSDIFKAKMYTYTDNKKRFINRWNALSSSSGPYDQMELFRRYMHILRAEDGITEKEEALRKYFGKSKWSRLEDCEKVMSDIEKIAAIEEWAISNYALWNIFYTYPNIYWRYPLIVFLHKYGNMENDEFILSKSKKSNFDNLIKETVKYFFIKGVVYNAVNKVKDTTFKVCKSISQEDDYVFDYEKTDKADFEEKIKLDNLRKYSKGLALIGAYLNEKQDSKLFFNIKDKWEIEHILPKQWKSDYYGNWDDERCSDIMNKLGNLMPLEKKLNIKAGNQFFKHKATHYRKSSIQDAIDLANMAENENNKEWLYEDFENRQNKILKRLETFFSS